MTKREIEFREGFDDFVEKILFRHARDMFVEPKAVDDVAYVRGELVDVAIEIRSELVRIIQQLFEVELRKIIKWPPRRALRPWSVRGGNRIALRRSAAK